MNAVNLTVLKRFNSPTPMRSWNKPHRFARKFLTPLDANGCVESKRNFDVCAALAQRSWIRGASR